MDTTIPTPASLLTRAAVILDERGWTQGDYYNETGCVCVLGSIHAAVAEAAGQDVTEDTMTFPRLPLGVEYQPLARAYNDAISDLNRQVPFGDLLASAIPDWNDKDGRTKEEVQEMLRLAAEAGVSS